MRREKLVKIPDLHGLACPKCGGANLEQMVDNCDFIICRSCIALYSYDEHVYDGKPCFRIKNIRSNDVFVLKEGSHWCEIRKPQLMYATHMS